MNARRDLPCLVVALVALRLILCAEAALALPDDRDQPIYIQSDRAERDERKGTTVYTGKVEIDQGSLHISADQVTIAMRGNQVNRIDANGKPVRIRQQPAPDQQSVQAQAHTLQYDVQNEVLILIDKASVTQEGSTVNGERIEYYMQEQRVKASAGSGRPGETSRVQMVIQPRHAQNAAPASPASDESTADTEANGNAP